MSNETAVEVTEEHRAAAHGACHPLAETCGNPHGCERIARAFAERDAAAEQRGAEEGLRSAWAICRDRAAQARSDGWDMVENGLALAADQIMSAIRARKP